MRNRILYLIIVLSWTFSLYAQTITSVSPNSALLGQSLTVSVYGQGTSFSMGTVINSYLNLGPSILNLSSVNLINDTLLSGILTIPSNADTGYWDVNVDTSLTGTITKVNGFHIGANLLSVTTSQTNVTCALLCNGTATAIASGCAPYAYLWDDPGGQTSSTANGLCSGVYSVTVTGNLGCNSVQTLTITEPSLLWILVSSVNDTASCAGSGSALVSGGTVPYTYLWDDPLNQTMSTAASLCQGVFHVMVTDNNGCTLTDSIEIWNIAGAAITQVSPDTVQLSQSLTVSIYSQNTWYTQATGVGNVWFNQGASILNLSAVNVINDTLLNGILNVPSNVSTGYWDANVDNTVTGVLKKVNGLYIDFNGLSLSLSKTDPPCGSTCNGIASVVSLGCSGIYTYLWDDPSSQTTSNATGLCGGTYSVIVSDNTGCTANGSVTITQPTLLTNFTSAINDVGGCTGSGTIVSNGGTTPYFYLWNDPMVQTTASATGLCSGSYQATVTDNNGCSTIEVVTVQAASIVSMSPDTGYLGQSLTVNIYGQNTMFSQATTIPSAWLSKGLDIINLSAINVISDNLLTSVLNIPSNAKQGYWAVNVFSDNNGTMSKSNEFFICGGDCVWPGDANSDNIANNVDLLAIGIAFGSTGTIRAGATNNWVGQFATNWTDTLNSGTNYKHTDCNGDGVVDNNDTLAITLNYGLTHNKMSLPNVAAATDPTLYLDIVTDTISVGGQLNIMVMLGTSSISADSMYGLAFTINYNPDLIDPGTVQMSFANSWLGTIGTDLISLQYDSYTDGRIDLAVVRTDQVEVTGFGQIGELVLTIASSLPGGPTGLDTMLFTISDLSVITSKENLLSTNITNDSLIVEDVTSGLDYTKKEAREIHIYPNPNTGQFTITRNNIEYEGELTLIVYQINGQKILEKLITDKEIKIDLTQMGKGVYYLQIVDETGITTKKVIVH